MAKVISTTMRIANLVGYDPQNTKSASLPIVTALLKIVSVDGDTILFNIIEAVYIKHSSIILLLEYQMRKHCLVASSVELHES